MGRREVGGACRAGTSCTLGRLRTTGGPTGRPSILGHVGKRAGGEPARAIEGRISGPGAAASSAIYIAARRPWRGGRKPAEEEKRSIGRAREGRGGGRGAPAGGPAGMVTGRLRRSAAATAVAGVGGTSGRAASETQRERSRPRRRRSRRRGGRIRSPLCGRCRTKPPSRDWAVSGPSAAGGHPGVSQARMTSAPAQHGEGRAT